MPTDSAQISALDAPRLVLSGLGATPGALQLGTYSSAGALLDLLSNPPLTRAPCPPNSSSHDCWSTLPILLTPDKLDREYAAAKGRAIEAALGGELRVEYARRVVAKFQIGAPRSAAFAPYDRLSAKLRVRILRVTPGGAPAIGGDSASAIRIARAEIATASKLWSQCGVDLEGPKGAEIEVVDPPPPELLAIGCDSGLPASGGFVSFALADRRVRVPTHAGESPLVVADRVARAIRALGLRAWVSPNQRTSAGVAGAVDVLARSPDNAPIAIRALPNAELSNDATLSVCLGEVELGNGLSHFVESDAAAGTLEERALVKAFDDGDPSTIDVFIVPSFDQSGRIGESFIDDDGSAIQNTVIIDRAAVRAGPRSYALAHEIGHILLDMPGHPDDYGVDQSSALMDADAADASVFGPRRLSLDDCERALRESGPTARIPILKSWPFSQREPAKRATSAR
ncbi:MAG TPA: hypothetical protein VHV51_02265 [Polyangiaceae bacterium]|nr:hypothetical protein [Polyangiaceae bacterium]